MYTMKSVRCTKLRGQLLLFLATTPKQPSKTYVHSAPCRAMTRHGQPAVTRPSSTPLYARRLRRPASVPAVGPPVSLLRLGAAAPRPTLDAACRFCAIHVVGWGGSGPATHPHGPHGAAAPRHEAVEPLQDASWRPLWIPQPMLLGRGGPAGLPGRGGVSSPVMGGWVHSVSGCSAPLSPCATPAGLAAIFQPIAAAVADTRPCRACTWLPARRGARWAPAALCARSYQVLPPPLMGVV